MFFSNKALILTLSLLAASTTSLEGESRFLRVKENKGNGAFGNKPDFSSTKPDSSSNKSDSDSSSNKSDSESDSSSNKSDLDLDSSSYKSESDSDSSSNKSEENMMKEKKMKEKKMKEDKSDSDSSSSKSDSDSSSNKPKKNKKKRTKYVADLGQYGKFKMVISGDDSSMNWKVDLENIFLLESELDMRIESLNYHLHTQWTNTNATYAIGMEGCGPAVAGGHYDPFFACGPASGVSADTCKALGRERSSERYACSGAYDMADYAQCEVGDLSGKYGGLPVDENGKVGTKVKKDPLPALDVHYVREETENSPEKFSSIVFHVGSPRVLCGKLMVDE